MPKKKEPGNAFAIWIPDELRDRVDAIVRARIVAGGPLGATRAAAFREAIDQWCRREERRLARTRRR